LKEKHKTLLRVCRVVDFSTWMFDVLRAKLQLIIIGYYYIVERE
jgi:hypothetical protein